MGTRNVLVKRETSAAWQKSNLGFEAGPGNSGTAGTMKLSPSGLTFPDGTTQTTGLTAAAGGASVVTGWGRSDLTGLTTSDTPVQFSGIAAGTGAGGVAIASAASLVGMSVLFFNKSGVAGTITFTAYKNGVATALTVVMDITSSAVGYTILGTPITLSAGDTLTVDAKITGTPTTAYAVTLLVKYA
jgi:hypothetical protein